MQGCDINILVVNDKVNAFVRKIGLWKGSLIQLYLSFIFSGKYLEKLDCRLIKCSLIHCSIPVSLISILLSSIKAFNLGNMFKLLSSILLIHEVSPPNNDFSLEEEENYIDLTSDTSLKLRFRREHSQSFGWALEKNTVTSARKL
jgi:hypothetical protein